MKMIVKAKWPAHIIIIKVFYIKDYRSIGCTHRNVIENDSSNTILNKKYLSSTVTKNLYGQFKLAAKNSKNV